MSESLRSKEDHEYLINPDEMLNACDYYEGVGEIGHRGRTTWLGQWSIPGTSSPGWLRIAANEIKRLQAEVAWYRSEFGGQR